MQSTEKIKKHLSSHFNLTEEQIEGMLPGFITTIVSHMQNLENTLAAKDPKLTGRAGHKIKGALLNLGMEECSKIAFMIEEKGKAGDMSADFQKLVDELRGCLDSVTSPLFPSRS